MMLPSARCTTAKTTSGELDMPFSRSPTYRESSKSRPEATGVTNTCATPVARRSTHLREKASILDGKNAIRMTAMTATKEAISATNLKRSDRCRSRKDMKSPGEPKKSCGADLESSQSWRSRSAQVNKSAAPPTHESWPPGARAHPSS